MFTRLHRTAALALAATVLTSCESAPTEPVDANTSLAEFRTSPVTLDWQARARTLVAQRSMSPLAAGRLYAAVGMAAMRAVEQVDASTEAAAGSNGRSRYEARRGAVAGASAQVLAWFVPTAAGDLEALVTAQGNAGPGDVHPQFTRGVAIGRAAGDAILQHVMNDGFTAPWTGTIPVGPGMWTPSAMPPAGGTLGAVTPYFLTTNDQFRPAPPPPYLSAEFNADLANVVATNVGLTPQQRGIATGWAYGGGTYTPLGYWNELAAKYVTEDGLDEAAAAKVFGLMGAAVFDAMIACFEAKYFYYTLRPHQAAPMVPVFAVPNYPAYPSGHGSVSASSARVLEHFFPARAAELDALVHEAAMSRIYAGIHYWFDMTAARTMAESVADWVIANGE
jgi:hypothetical protein